MQTCARGGKNSLRNLPKPPPRIARKRIAMALRLCYNETGRAGSFEARQRRRMREPAATLLRPSPQRNQMRKGGCSVEKRIVKVVLTGGPAAGKTTLVSRILKEFNSEGGWKVITIPETATELISGFGIKPFDNCVTMLEFQYFVIADQLHKEKLAIKAAEMVPEQNVLILYDRALLDDKAYITDKEFDTVLRSFDGRTTASVLAGYDAVIHLVTCANGAEFAYNLGNEARSESIEKAIEMDNRTLRAWSPHPNLKIVDNAVDFEQKIQRAMREIYRIVGEPEPMPKKRKFLVRMPDLKALLEKREAVAFDMVQTYLVMTNPNIERRVRMQKNGGENLYFFNEKHTMPDNTKWDTERPISEKAYNRYLLEADPDLQPVHKIKYRFNGNRRRYELDVYPFSEDKAILFCYTDGEVTVPDEIEVLRDVTGDLAYKNRHLAATQSL